jgi:hypothetical protein
MGQVSEEFKNNFHNTAHTPTFESAASQDNELHHHTAIGRKGIAQSFSVHNTQAPPATVLLAPIPTQIEDDQAKNIETN